MKHGNYKLHGGKIHLYRGKRDLIYGGVYECGLAVPDVMQKNNVDIFTTQRLTCKRCIKTREHARKLLKLLRSSKPVLLHGPAEKHRVKNVVRRLAK